MYSTQIEYYLYIHILAMAYRATYSKVYMVSRLVGQVRQQKLLQYNLIEYLRKMGLVQRKSN